MRMWTTACPGPLKNTGDDARLLLFTLPWRGRVASDSERGGVNLRKAEVHPTPSVFTSFRRPTLPLQGRVEQ